MLCAPEIPRSVARIDLGLRTIWLILSTAATIQRLKTNVGYTTLEFPRKKILLKGFKLSN